jgi:cell division protein FtsN
MIPVRVAAERNSRTVTARRNNRKIEQAMRVGICIFFLSGILASSSLAQQPGRIEEQKDPLIESLQRLRAAYQGTGSTLPGEKKGMKTTARGFRVQIYSGADRNQAYAEQARFKRTFPDLETYISYEEPNYRVKVGDFTSRSEAQEIMRALKKNFTSVFLFSETINVEY